MDVIGNLPLTPRERRVSTAIVLSIAPVLLASLVLPGPAIWVGFGYAMLLQVAGLVWIAWLTSTRPKPAADRDEPLEPSSLDQPEPASRKGRAVVAWAFAIGFTVMLIAVLIGEGPGSVLRVIGFVAFLIAMIGGAFGWRIERWRNRRQASDPSRSR